MIVWGICLRWTQVTGGENGMRGDVRPAVLLTNSAFYWAVLAGAAVVAFAMWRFVRSPFGLTLRGIRDSESRMRSLGYNVPLHLSSASRCPDSLPASQAHCTRCSTTSSARLPWRWRSQSRACDDDRRRCRHAVWRVRWRRRDHRAGERVSAYTERWQMVLGITFILIMIFAPEGIIGKLRATLTRKVR